MELNENSNNRTSNVTTETKCIRVLEFYSGIGGMNYSLQRALQGRSHILY